MNRPGAWGIVGIAMAIVAAASYFGLQRIQRPPTAQSAASVQEPPRVPTVAEDESVPRIRYPMEQYETLASPDGDTALWDGVIALIDDKALEALLKRQDFVKRVVATVDNLPRRKLPQRLMPVAPARGLLQVIGEGNDASLSPANYSRYEPYVRLMQSVKTSELTALYARHYSLFQQAYRDLGYSTWYFNDRVVEAIDDLLATPELMDPPVLDRPKVFYLFQDPELEGLSAGQKIMIRIGPLNAAKVKVRLREIRQELVSHATR